MSAYTVEDESAIDALADGDLVRVYDLSTKAYKYASMAQYRAGVSGGMVVTTATTLTITAATHSGKTVLVNSASPIAVGLPLASASGMRIKFVIGVVATATPHIIAANTTDVLAGVSVVVTTTSSNVEGWATSATTDKISLNGTTKGGIVGDTVEFIDVAVGTWSVQHIGAATGTEVTPFDAT